MFNDYEEYLREPSEVDGIIEEMKEELYELITEHVGLGEIKSNRIP